MKKFINVLAVLLALVMCLGVVVACATDDEGAADGTTAAQGTTTAGGTTKPDNTQNTTTAQDTTTAEPTDELNFTPKTDVPADGMITNADQLHAVLVNGDVTKSYTVTAQTLDMAGLGWVGMKGYSGTFDFGGCTVKNVCAPMFTSVEAGTVKNLILADSKLVYTNDDAEADADLIPLGDTATSHCQVYGGVIRLLKDGVVSNVTVESSVEISADIYLKDSYVGGILAYAKGTNIRVENCTFKGTVTTDSVKIFIGGIAGSIEGTDPAAHNVDDLLSSAVIGINCHNYGTVQNVGVNEDSKTAGVFGAFGSGLVYKCGNFGTIESTDGGQTGGVIGHTLNELTYMYCLNAGVVKGGTGYVGGVVGYSNGTVRNFVGCVNVGTVTNSEGSSTTRLAGIMGWLRNSENVVNCYNLTTACPAFIVSKGSTSEPLDPADPSTHVSEKTPTITDCANLDTVEAVLAAIEGTHPGVFVKDGNSLKFAE